MISGYLSVLDVAKMSLVVFLAISAVAFIWAMIDIIKTKNDIEWKILWMLVCLFLGVIGVIIYLVAGRKKA